LFQRLQRWKTLVYKGLLKMPALDLTDEQRAVRDGLAQLSPLTILQLIYRQKVHEGNAKDYEFFRQVDASGHKDTRRTLRNRDWLVMLPENTGIITHDIRRDQ
jgi:NTE family protein